MDTLALALTLAGLALSLVGAAWLQWGISPDDERFQDDGLLYPGRQQSKVLPAYIRAQQKPTLLVILGGGIQVIGGVLALIAL